MGIALGSIIQPITLLCSSKGNKAWNGLIRFHLKLPTKDGAALLKGHRIFILTLDGVLKIIKVARGFTLMAPCDQLFYKIISESLTYLESHEIFVKIIKDGFCKKLEFEVTQVQQSM